MLYLVSIQENYLKKNAFNRDKQKYSINIVAVLINIKNASLCLTPPTHHNSFV